MICLTRDERVMLRRRASFVSLAWSSAGSLTVRTFMRGPLCVPSLIAIREYIIYFSKLMSYPWGRPVLVLQDDSSPQMSVAYELPDSVSRASLTLRRWRYTADAGAGHLFIPW